MSNFVKSEHVYLDKAFKKKDDLLTFLSEEAAKSYIATSADECKAAFEQRELEMSTGVVDGFAIPHAKANCIKEAAVMVVRSSEAMEDWISLDGSQITCAIALLVPGSEAGSTHLKLLSQTAVMLMNADFRKAVREATVPSEIADLINSHLEAKS